MPNNKCITSPSTIVPSALDSKPLRAFSPVMAGVRCKMPIKLFVLTIFTFLLLGCSGDASLLSTPLPNGYSFHSNGGEFGYIKTPNGHRMALHFGIINSENNEIEAWCNEFAWKNNYVICKRSEYSASNSTPSTVNYFILNTKDGSIEIQNKPEAQEFWHNKTGTNWPEMKVRHRSTSSK